MAYNSYFPMGYQPAQIYPQYQQQQNSNPSLIWVQGEAGAKSYLVAPNQTVTLWDSEAQVIYLKSADASGMPSIKVLDYTIRDTAQKTENAIQGNFATKNDVDTLREEIEAIKRDFEAQKTSRSYASTEGSER